MFRVRLERDQAAAWWQGSCEPDGAVTAKRPDLEDTPCAAKPCEDLQQLPMRGRDVDSGQSCGVTGAKRVVQHGIGLEQFARKILVNASPWIWGHSDFGAWPSAFSFQLSALSNQLSALGAELPAARYRLLVSGSLCFV